MLLWLLTRLTYLAGEPDGVKCILIRMFSQGMDGARGVESNRRREGGRGREVEEGGGSKSLESDDIEIGGERIVE